MDQLVKYVLDEMRVIGDAPVVFVAAILVVAAAVWWAMNLRYSRIVKNMERTIALYRNRLDGASPDEA